MKHTERDFIISEEADEEDRLASLDIGADDYATMPFSSQKLAARIRTVPLPDGLDSQATRLTYGPFSRDLQQRIVYVGKTRLHLTSTEFRLLVFLPQEAGRTFFRGQIIGRVFGYDFGGFDRTMHSHIYSLRRKLESAAEERGTFILYMD